MARRNRKKNYQKRQSTRVRTLTPRLRSLADVYIQTVNSGLLQPRTLSTPYTSPKQKTKNNPVTTVTITPGTARNAKKASLNVLSQAVYAVPDKTMICLRRQQRKEVLHALNKSGKAGQKQPNITPQSKINCKG